MSSSRIPRPTGTPSPSTAPHTNNAKLLSPPDPSRASGTYRKSDRSVSTPVSPTPGSPQPRTSRPRANTRIPSPLASPEKNHARPQSKSYFRPRASSRASPPARSPSPALQKSRIPPKLSPASPKPSLYTTRRPVPAYSDRETGVPRTTSRNASTPILKPSVLRAMPIQSLSGGKPITSIPKPAPLPAANTDRRKRATSFSLKPMLKFKPGKPPEAPKSTRLAGAMTPSKPPVVSRANQAMSMNVPPHVRLRLRLIHQLSVVLNIPPAKISAVLDVPALLARVDAVFEKGTGMNFKREREGSVVSIPGEAVRGTRQNDMWWMYPPNWNAADVAEESHLPGRPRRGSSISQIEGRGLLDRLRKLGRKEETPQMVGASESFDAAPEDSNLGVEDTSTALEESVEQELGAGTTVNPFAWMGSAFGVAVMDLPAEAWCRTRFGGHIHELPLVLYLTIEHIWKHGGITVSGIFRLSGNTSRVEHLAEVFAKPPLYGDQYPLQSTESPHNMACVLKRWLRDLPEPIVDDALGPALFAFCAEADIADLSVPPDPSRIAAARILLQLLPPPSFSIMTYLLAFLSQLALTIENKLGRDAIAIIFGPALIASRSCGVPGLGPRSRGCKDPDAVSIEVDRSQKTLGWLVAHWPIIAEGIMECAIPDPFAKAAPITAIREGDIDRRLLSPIDLRKNSSDTIHSGNIPDLAEGLGDLDLSFDVDRWQPSRKGLKKSESHTGLGLLSRAFSSKSISSLYSAVDDGPEKERKVLKKSQSFSNLSGMLKRTLTGGSAKHRISSIDREWASRAVLKADITHDLDDFWSGKTTPFPVPRSRERSVSVNGLHTRAPSDQITSVLSSLQDLLSAKDRQIERDARELAILRHTLLEMDEKLQRVCSCSRTSTPMSKSSSAASSPDLLRTPPTPSTPEITITASDSVQEIKDSVVLDLQSQLSTAMSALESVRVKNRMQAERISQMEAGAEKTEKWYNEQVREKDGEIALEIARGKGWRLERDVARRRLEKVKEDLFGVSG